MESRNLFAIVVAPQANVNISRFNDNQAEATIAIDPTNPQYLFSASMTFHGPLEGSFDPNFDIPGLPNRNHTPGLFVAFSDNFGRQNSWIERVMATGGGNELYAQERSLPAAVADPQAAFDDYGNLYLTYLAGPLAQSGTASGGDAQRLFDTSRAWAPDMWAAQATVTLRPGGFGGRPEETILISGNTARTLTMTAVWGVPPRAGDPYRIDFVYSRAVVVLQSQDRGVTFQFLKIMDQGPAVDYPAIATGPGRTANEKSVWVAWRGSTGRIIAEGAPVTGRGAVGAFMPAQPVPGSDGMALPRVAVGPDGRVMVSFHSAKRPDQGPPQVGDPPTTIWVNVDQDGLGPGDFRPTLPANPVTTSNIVIRGPGDAPIPAQPHRGITPGVSLAWDRSGLYGTNPTTHGRVYLVHTDAAAGIIVPSDPAVDTNVYVQSSDDSGLTWSAPRLVHGLNDDSQFMPSIAVDQTTGDVAVVWLDTRDDPDHTFVRLYGALSVNGGMTFLAPMSLSDGQSYALNADSLQRGTTLAGSTNTTLSISGQREVPDNYWGSNFEVDITGTGPDAGRFRNITASRGVHPGDPRTAQLTVDPAWNAGGQVVPAAGQPVEIRWRLGGLPSNIYNFDFGDYTGLAFHDGIFYPIWADNSNSTDDNPNGTSEALDLYTAQVWVIRIPDPIPGESAASTAGTVRLGTRSFTAVPSTSLLEAALLLGAQRTSTGPAPTGAAFDRFVREVYARVQRLGALRAASPTSPAALLLGGSRPRPAPSLQAIDLFFRAAWADGVLSAADLRLTLG